MNLAMFFEGAEKRHQRETTEREAREQQANLKEKEHQSRINASLASISWQLVFLNRPGAAAQLNPYDAERRIIKKISAE